MTPEERQPLIARIRSFPDVLEAAVRSLTPDQLTAEALPGEWTIAQVVHHLADAHMHAYARFKHIQVEEYPTFKPYEQTDWAETPEARDAHIADSLAILRGLHHRWARLMESLTDEQWARKGLHPDLGEISAEGLLIGYVNHSQNHLLQIGKTYEALQTLT
ncbi:MAG: DinB family protein [Chloroflexi bacterium]|nr:DinB family protein [Chloroflexota bacterium]